MSVAFGEKVKQDAAALAEQGKDPNQIANILCQKDSQGSNYGIGIILGGDGKPMASSKTLLKFVRDEIENSQVGSYLNSAKLMGDLKSAVLHWQRIPESYWDRFQLVLPSDAGTGAVQTAVQVASQLNPSLNTLGIEEFGWPAYKAIAKVARFQSKEFPSDGVITGPTVLPIYQAGPMNTTGQVKSEAVVKSRAQAAGKEGAMVILDRAYSGFEYARLIGEKSYDEIMTMSFEGQIKPYLEAGVPFSLALSPTKSFVTFSLRPCGLLLTYSPDPAQTKAVSQALNTTIRARGSSFEHTVTRGFAKAMTNDLTGLEAEHQHALERLAEAEQTWRSLAKGTPLEVLFSDHYAGLFRNPQFKEDASVHVYNEHMYPVFSKDRCRLNATGIPSDHSQAKKHVAVFAQYCLSSD